MNDRSGTAIKEGNLALISMGVQRKFAYGMIRDPLMSLVPDINRATAAFRERGMPVVFALRDGSFQAYDGDDGDELLEGIVVGEDDILVHKQGSDAFEGTGLAETLRGRGVEGVVICGLIAHIGVLSTYAGAAANKFSPYVTTGNASSTGDIDRFVEASVRVVTAEEILASPAFSGPK